MEKYLEAHFRLFNRRQLELLRTVDVFDEMIDLQRFFLRQCGVDIVLMEKFRWNFRTYLCLLCIALFSLSIVYTVYARWTDWYGVLDTLSVSGIGFQGMIKLHGGLAKKTYFQEKYLNIRALHQRSSEHPRNNLSMMKCALIILYVFRFFLVIYAVAGSAFFVLPLYLLITKHEKALIFPLELPFVDTFSGTGYVILSVYHAVLVIIGILGILAADMGVMIYVLHIVGIVDVFINNLDELDEMLLQTDISDRAKQQKFTEICIMHREIIRYEEDLDECYYYTVFVQVITSVSCLSLTLFVVYMTKDWTRGLFILATFFQLLEFCVLGTALRVKNDHVIDAIYNCKWHLLTASDKRRLAIMLHRAQNPVEMTIGGLYMLNMETFVEIIKTIYSYFTMMISFLE